MTTTVTILLRFRGDYWVAEHPPLDRGRTAGRCSGATRERAIAAIQSRALRDLALLLEERNFSIDSLRFEVSESRASLRFACADTLEGVMQRP